MKKLTLLTAAVLTACSTAACASAPLAAGLQNQDTAKNPMILSGPDTEKDRTESPAQGQKKAPPSAKMA